MYDKHESLNSRNRALKKQNKHLIAKNTSLKNEVSEKNEEVEN